MHLIGCLWAARSILMRMSMTRMSQLMAVAVTLVLKVLPYDYCAYYC